jgi:hypothetical protein
MFTFAREDFQFMKSTISLFALIIFSVSVYSQLILGDTSMLLVSDQYFENVSENQLKSIVIQRHYIEDETSQLEIGSTQLKFYQFDEKGRLLEYVSDGVSHQYVYDAAGRVIAFSRSFLQNDTLPELPEYEFQIVYEKNKISLIKRTFDKQKIIKGAVQEEFWLISLQEGVIGYEGYYYDFIGEHTAWTRNSVGVWYEQVFDKTGKLIYENNHHRELDYTSMLSELFFGFGIYNNSEFMEKSVIQKQSSMHYVWNPGITYYWDEYVYTHFE